MSFLNVINNTWTKEELTELERYKDKTLDFLVDLFKHKGFDRSRDAIKKKRSKLLKNKFATIAKENSKELEKIEVKVSAKFETTLCVADCHIHPGQNLDRFIALGKYANDKKPNNIIFLGDIGDFDSLSNWDSGKEASHGKRYKDEIKACKSALVLFLAQFDKDYKPNLVLLGGNHDQDRIERYIATHAQLRGHLNLEEDLGLEELGFKFVPYRKFYEINGTMFSHAIMSASNSPVSGKSLMNTIASLVAKSTVVGHHHKFATMNFARHGSEDVLQVLLVGMFSEDTPSYADGAVNSYSRSVCLLTHFGYGKFDTDQISIDRLKAEYL